MKFNLSFAADLISKREDKAQQIDGRTVAKLNSSNVINLKSNLWSMTHRRIKCLKARQRGCVKRADKELWLFVALIELI